MTPLESPFNRLSSGDEWYCSHRDTEEPGGVEGDNHSDLKYDGHSDDTLRNNGSSWWHKASMTPLESPFNRISSGNGWCCPHRGPDEPGGVEGGNQRLEYAGHSDDALRNNGSSCCYNASMTSMESPFNRLSSGNEQHCPCRGSEEPGGIEGSDHSV